MKRIIRLSELELTSLIKQVINNSNTKKFILKEECVKSMALIDPKTGKPAYIDSKTGKYCKPKTTTTQRSVNPTEKNLTDLIVVNSKPSNKKTISPKYVKKIRLIFPAPGIETTALNFFKKELLFLGIITGFYTSLSSAISFIKTLIKKNVKADELVIGSHGSGSRLLMTQSNKDYFLYNNSFLNSFKPLIHSNTKVFFTACYGADNLSMLKDAAERLGVGVYGASGIYNYITNSSERGFYWCSPSKIPQGSNNTEVIYSKYLFGINPNIKSDNNIFFKFALNSTNSSFSKIWNVKKAYITIKNGVFDKSIPKKIVINLDEPKESIDMEHIVDDEDGSNSRFKIYYNNEYSGWEENATKTFVITQKIMDIGNVVYNGISQLIEKNEIIGDSKNNNVILRKEKKMGWKGRGFFINFIKEKIESDEISIEVIINGKLTNIKSLPVIKFPNREGLESNSFLIKGKYCKKVPKSPISFTNPFY
jgi:hypothetical protein